MIWHSHTAAEALQELNTDIAVGLSSDAAAARLNEYGENRLTDKPSTMWRLFTQRMKSVTAMIVLLIAAITLGVSAYGFVVNLTPIEWIGPAAIVTVVILGAVLGAIQDIRGEEDLRRLRDLSAPDARVRRDGQLITVPAYTLVPGDIIELTAGNRVPADCRLVETCAFICDESLLTGDASSVKKDADSIYENIAPLSARTNMVYAGCAVMGGTAVAVVVATGVQSEMGHLAAKTQRQPQKGTSLRDRMGRVGKLVGLLTVAVCVVLVIVALILRMPLMEVLTVAATLAVAMSPEGLIPAVTLALTRGARRSAQRNAVIRRSSVIETLGNVSVIGTNGAGMLPPSKMALTRAFVNHQTITLGNDLSAAGLPQLLQLAVLCTDTETDDPTDAAILAYAERVGVDRERLLDDMPRVNTVPCDSTRAITTAIHRADNATVIIVKGEPEAVFSLCTCGHIDEAADAFDSMTGDGLRVIAVAYKILRESPTVYATEELERDLKPAGLIGLTDTTPTDTAEAVRRCEEAGIRTVIMTGERLSVACTIAHKLGIASTEESAVTGSDLAAMRDEELDNILDHRCVYAQLTRDDTVRLIKALQRRGNVVAVIGADADDAAALDAADIGCAMGSGTDIAKDAADATLTDDRYDSILSAVGEGRRIRDAVRKIIHLLLSCRLGAALAVIAATLIWRAGILFPIHLLWINLITAVLSALSLGVETTVADVMHRPPHSGREALLPRRATWQAIFEGVMFAVLTLVAYYVGAIVWENASLGVTMAFATLAIAEALHPLIIRSPRSVFVSGFGNTKAVLWSSLAALTTILAVLLIPGVQSVFSLSGMSLTAWGVVLCLALEPLIITEACKGVRKILKK